MARKKFYAVREGRKKFVITSSWNECEALIKGYPGAKYKGFSSREEAEAWLYERDREYDGIPKDAIFCDGSADLNSGRSEAQVTDINGKRLVGKELGPHTNNYAELAALGMAVVYAISNKRDTIYTDSNTVLSWIMKGSGRVTRDADTIQKMIDKINKMLRDNPNIRILKWDTGRYGEIPADFGRK